MKKIIIALIALCSLSAFAETIKHQNCRLNVEDVILSNRAQKDLHKKGYTLYNSDLELGTLNLSLKVDGRYYEDESGWIMDKNTYQISISNVFATGTSKIFESSSSFSIEWEEVGQEFVKKETRTTNKLLKRIPRCLIKL